MQQQQQKKITRELVSLLENPYRTSAASFLHLVGASFFYRPIDNEARTDIIKYPIFGRPGPLER